MSNGDGNSGDIEKKLMLTCDTENCGSSFFEHVRCVQFTPKDENKRPSLDNLIPITMNMAVKCVKCGKFQGVFPLGLIKEKTNIFDPSNLGSVENLARGFNHGYERSNH